MFWEQPTEKSVRGQLQTFSCSLRRLFSLQEQQERLVAGTMLLFSRIIQWFFIMNSSREEAFSSWLRTYCPSHCSIILFCEKHLLLWSVLIDSIVSIMGCYIKRSKEKQWRQEPCGENSESRKGADSLPALVAAHITEAFYCCKEQRDCNRTMRK